jgi:competence protein ComEC
MLCRVAEDVRSGQCQLPSDVYSAEPAVGCHDTTGTSTFTMKRILLTLYLLLFIAGSTVAQTLRIYQIDVEQADAALVVTPSGKTLLIDSGKNGMGKRIRTVMQQAGVTQIDAFVDSHYHEDHYGGIDDLVDAHVSVLESFDRGDRTRCIDADKKKEKAFKGYMRTVGEDAIPLKPGDAIVVDPLVTITAVSSSGLVIGETGLPSGCDENDLSVSLWLTFAGFKAFFGGDIEQPTEAKIASRHLVTDVDLYKADHHGSDTSSSPAFMSDLRPSVVVISNGSHKTFKHPRIMTFNTFTGLPIPPTVFQTNKCKQALPCKNAPDAFIADPETKDQDGTIVVTVDGAMGSFTVGFGTAAPRTFPVKAPVAVTPVLTTAAAIVIESLLPNPVGDDDQLEAVTIRNKSTSAVSLVGWTLQDRSHAAWNLTGSLGPGQSRTFLRNGQGMSLNNAGDEIVLVDAANVERDRFEYSASSEGTVIQTQH